MTKDKFRLFRSHRHTFIVTLATLALSASGNNFKPTISSVKNDIIHTKSFSNESKTGIEETFFTPGYAEVKGRIEDYNPESGPRNFLVYFQDNLIGSMEPVSVEIADDGSFITWIPLTTPGYARFVGDNRFFDFFLVPDRTLEVSFRWEDVADYLNKKRNGEQPSESPFRFGADLSRINKELTEYSKNASYGVYTMAHDLIPSDAIKRLTDDYERQIREIDQCIGGKDLDPVTTKLLKANVKSKYLFDVFEYARTREGLQRTDTLAPSLKEPLDLNYFDSVKEVLADDDKWVLASSHFGGVPNMMGQSSLQKLLGLEDHFIFDFGINAFPYLKSLGAELTLEEEEINRWLGEGGRKSCTLKELTKGMNGARNAAERNGLSEQLNEYYQQHKKDDEKPNHGPILGDASRNVRDVSEAIKEYLGVETLPLLWQVALSEALRSKFQLRAEYYTDKDKLHEVLETIKTDGEISHPAILESLGNFYRRAYARKSFDIPDDARGKVIRDLIAPFAGKTLLIDFWGISCGPCCHAIKNSVKARAINRNHPDFKMIFISDDTDSESRYKDFVTKYLDGETTYRISESDFHLLRDLFAFSGIPRYVLIGPDGKVLDSDFKFHTMKRDLKQYGIELEADPLEGLIIQK